MTVVNMVVFLCSSIVKRLWAFFRHFFSYVYFEYDHDYYVFPAYSIYIHYTSYSFLLWRRLANTQVFWKLFITLLRVHHPWATKLPRNTQALSLRVVKNRELCLATKGPGNSLDPGEKIYMYILPSPCKECWASISITPGWEHN